MVYHRRSQPDIAETDVPPPQRFWAAQRLSSTNKSQLPQLGAARLWHWWSSAISLSLQLKESIAHQSTAKDCDACLGFARDVNDLPAVSSEQSTDVRRDVSMKCVGKPRYGRRNNASGGAWELCG